jgi:plastocyanin
MSYPTRPCPTPPRRGPRTAGRIALPVLLAGAVVLSGCSTSFQEDEARDTQTVKINVGAGDPTALYPFSPSPFNVNLKTEIVWTNMDTTAHQIASLGGLFQAPAPIEPGKSYSFLFNDRGNYRYYCLLPNHREEGLINVVP